jgi:hypothetical protein
MQLKRIFGYKMFTGLILVGAAGQLGIHFYEKNASGPAYDPQNAAHLQLSRQFVSSCAPSPIVEPQKINDALDHSLLTGTPPLVKIEIDASAFRECIGNKTQHALDMATLPTSQWVNLDKANRMCQILLAFGLVATRFKMHRDEKRDRGTTPEPPAP